MADIIQMTILLLSFLLFALLTATSALDNCTLAASHDIESELADGPVLIKYYLQIPQSDKLVERLSSTQMYQPLFWVRVAGRQGKGLLLLRPDYHHLSLKTLEVGVTTLKIDVEQYPPSCMHQLSKEDTEPLLRRLVMNDFQNTSSSTLNDHSKDDSICNMHVTDDSGTARFRYYCCSQVHENNCDYIKSDSWLDILFTALLILKILIVLFSPMMVPDFYYREKHVASSYIHRCQSKKKISLNVTMTTNLDRIRNTKTTVALSELCDMKVFKKHLAGMDMDIPRQFHIEQINLKVKHDRLLPEDNAPVQLFRALYDSIFRCKISERPAVKDCCDADFMLKSPCCKRRSWFNVLTGAMQVVFMLLLTVPWFIRVAAYYRWEHEDITDQKNAAEDRNLKLPYPGNITLYLSPIHELFLFIYVFLVVETCVYGVLGNAIQEKSKVILRQCFRDMREISKLDAIGWVVRILIKPCKQYGGLGLILGFLHWIFALPVLLLIVIIYILPTLNITFRLLAYFVAQLLPKTCFVGSSKFSWLYRWLDGMVAKLEVDRIIRYDILELKLLTTCANRIQQMFVIILCLISMYSIIFLIMECVSFVVEVIVYTMMGIILNSGTLLTYVSLIIIVGLYGNEVFGNVVGKFLQFNKKLHEIILSACREKVEQDVFSKTTNVAFMVKMPHSTEVKNHAVLTTNLDGCLQWNVKRLCLFLSNTEEPLIPTKFFFEACRLPYYAAPGEVLVSYMFAALEFGAILLFLVFVLVVILAFGESYELSVGNQLIATVFGGFIPFIFRKLVKATTYPTIDENNLHFQTSFNELLEEYEENWPVYDINVTEDADDEGVPLSGVSIEMDSMADVDKDLASNLVDEKENREYTSKVDGENKANTGVSKTDVTCADMHLEPAYSFNLVIDARNGNPGDNKCWV